MAKLVLWHTEIDEMVRINKASAHSVSLSGNDVLPQKAHFLGESMTG
jgi:hypothetical protein